MNTAMQSSGKHKYSRMVIDPNNPNTSTIEMAVLIEIALRMMVDKVSDEKISLHTKISLASLDYIRNQYLNCVIESGIDIIKQEILKSNTVATSKAITKEERAIEKERIRKRLNVNFPGIEEAALEAEKEMTIKREICLNMMLDHIPDEQIRKYTKISNMEIEYIRLVLLPKAIRDRECMNRAMNESLLRSMRSVRRDR